MNRVLVLVLFGLSGIPAFAQEKDKRVGRPDIPGSIMIDLGVNQGIGKPSDFDLGFWGSRTINVYYQYPIRIAKTNFSFNPGIGFGLDRFKLRNDFTVYDSTAVAGRFEFAPADLAFPGTRKSMLIANYIEMPLDFRFDTKPEDLARSFNVSIGGRVGYLFDGVTKVKYKPGSEVKINKDKQRHGLNQFRYGIYTRIGIGNFNVFSFYNFSTLFEEGKGPTGMDKVNTWTVGISLNSF